MPDTATAAASAKQMSTDERKHLIEELAAQVGKLRRRPDLGAAGYHLDSIAAIVETLWIHVTPTAAELVKGGLAVDAALAWSDGEKRKQHRTLAEDTVEARRLEALKMVRNAA